MIDLKAIRAAAEADNGQDHVFILRPATTLALLDRLEAAEKDAARYRWMRKADIPARYKAQFYTEFALDDHIDAAMKDEQK